MKLKTILTAVAIMASIGNYTFAQQPVFTFDFEPSSAAQIKESIPPAEAGVWYDIQQSIFVRGIDGYALDLSSDAVLRAAMKIENGTVKEYSRSDSYSFQIWIKTKKNARMGTAIAGNLNVEEPEKGGWLIDTHENGAWSLTLSDGKSMFEYKPTAERQSINDGKWHQIVFSLDNSKQEAWMYLDGRNVAIYNIAGLRAIGGDNPLIIGSELKKWNNFGQWNAFNGYLDALKIWNRPISADEVSELYATLIPDAEHEVPEAVDQLKILVWNIWHGGHRFGENVGVQRVIDIIKSSNADIIGLIETYGSGEEIADSLGYYFYLISTNLSIMSRYPITETIKAFRPFNFGGAKLNLGNGKEMAFFDTWLHYLPDYAKHIVERSMTSEELVADESKTRHSEIKHILKEIKPYLKNADNVPVILLGDFNSGSHLDWIEETKGQHLGYAIEWPESKEVINAGFGDSYRKMNINPIKDPGFTWSPQAANSSNRYGVRDRIDYIYYIGNQLEPLHSEVIDYHPVMFPSDHAAVVTTFKLK